MPPLPLGGVAFADGTQEESMRSLIEVTVDILSGLEGKEEEWVELEFMVGSL